MPLLDVKNLIKEFHGVRAVDDVSITVAVGETLGLVGESGCGKTTLSRCILRLEQPTSGQVTFDGRDLDHLSAEELRQLRRHAQIVFQDPFASLDPRWTIGRTVAEPLVVHKIVPAAERNSEVERLLASVGLPASAISRYPHEFSGGQRQRVGIARALALQPKFLIADEPVSALDVSVRAQILNLLKSAQQERKLGMLFIAHDLGAVRQVSHRIAVMYLGKVMEEGPTDDLFENPRHPYTRTLLAAIPSIKRIGAAREPSESVKSGDLPSPSNIPSGCRFRTRCAFAQDICAKQTPPDLEVSTGHRSACHFAESLPQFDFVTTDAASHELELAAAGSARA